MKNLLIVIGCIWTTVLSAQSPNKLAEFLFEDKAQELKNYKTEVVFGDIKVTKKEAIDNQEPKSKGGFQVYTYNRLINNKQYEVFITGGSNPLKPLLIIRKNDSTEIDRIQLLGNRQSTSNEEIEEETVITSQNEIILKWSIYKWQTDENGKRISRTGDEKHNQDKYKISNSGKIEPVNN